MILIMIFFKNVLVTYRIIMVAGYAAKWNSKMQFILFYYHYYLIINDTTISGNGAIDR